MALTTRKRNLIEAMITNPNLTNIELAELLEVNRNTITAWKKDAEVQAEFKQRLKEVWADGESIAINTMQTLAKRGNYAAAAYILDNLGYKATTKIDANVSNEIVINIGEDND